MENLLLFVLFPEFQGTFNTPNSEFSKTQIIGNLHSVWNSCQVQEKYDLKYQDTSIQNSLSSINGERSFPAFYHAFSPKFTPKKQSEILQFLIKNSSKKCSDFIVSMVKYDTESKNWILEIIDLTDFSYNIYLNNILIAKFDSYYKNEWLAFQTEFSPDKKHIITRVSSREVDASNITKALNEKIENIVGYYFDSTKIPNITLTSNDSDIQESLKNLQK